MKFFELLTLVESTVQDFVLLVDSLRHSARMKYVPIYIKIDCSSVRPHEHSQHITKEILTVRTTNWEKSY